ncbi:S-layer-like y domain-containing protein [Cohnella lubricantis]|uniref:S-layer homology domain-containing protein n=1 Tax=Cohnella lubricantis TaxID=2163172 RepID=UPI001FD88EAE|nr:S-layer homology domain-containing protein [Cohnella lubricantis]MBP2116900.1 hypothetical protein [Cohnella lubricantis]
MFTSRTLSRKLAITALATLAIGGVIAWPAANPRIASAASGLPFDDIAGSYAQADIISLYKQGIVGGTGPRTFEPGKAVTRAEFASMVVRLFGLESINASLPAFKDARPDAWYYGAVGAVSQLGIVSGVSANEFHPSAPVTREQAAAILVRALRLAAVSAASASVSYSDASRIDAWAVSAVRTATEAGLMQGDNGRFRPLDQLTRAETAALLNRVASRSEWAAQFKSAPKIGLQLGWQYGQTTSQYIASVSRSTVNTLVPRVFFLDSGSSFSESIDPALVKWASANGKQVWGMFGNRSNADNTHALLSSATNRKTVVAGVASLVQKHGMDGINLDFENVLPVDRAGLTAFVSELATALDKIGAVLSVDVSPDQEDDWTAAFDYAALGKSADYMVLMAYDEHWAGDPVAGSVSSLPWLERGTDKLLKSVPASKTIVALPLYTRDWTIYPKVSSSELSIADQTKYIESLASANRSWNDEFGQYIYTYAKSGATHRIWTEDSRSLTLKSLSAASRGTAGLAYWAIGSDTPDVWPSIRNAYKFASFKP